MYCSSRTLRRVALVLALALIFSLMVTPAADAAVSCAVPVATPAPVGWVSEVMGNRTRMIQIGCVMGAIGIFFLTRNYR